VLSIKPKSHRFDFVAYENQKKKKKNKKKERKRRKGDPRKEGKGRRMETSSMPPPPQEIENGFHEEMVYIPPHKRFRELLSLKSKREKRNRKLTCTHSRLQSYFFGQA